MVVTRATPLAKPRLAVQLFAIGSCSRSSPSPTSAPSPSALIHHSASLRPRHHQLNFQPLPHPPCLLLAVNSLLLAVNSLLCFVTPPAHLWIYPAYPRWFPTMPLTLRSHRGPHPLPSKAATARRPTVAIASAAAAAARGSHKKVSRYPVNRRPRRTFRRQCLPPWPYTRSALSIYSNMHLNAS